MKLEESSHLEGKGIDQNQMFPYLYRRIFCFLQYIIFLPQVEFKKLKFYFSICWPPFMKTRKQVRRWKVPHIWLLSTTNMSFIRIIVILYIFLQRTDYKIQSWKHLHAFQCTGFLHFDWVVQLAILFS